jgi:hypothetical protein
LYLNKCCNPTLISREFTEKVYTIVKHNKSEPENISGRSPNNLYTKYKREVPKINRKLAVIDQDFKTVSDITKIKYIRYVNHFILGIVGDKKLGYEAISYIAMVLDSLGIKLSSEKFSIKHHTKGIVFLGYRISHNRWLNIKSKR